MFDFKKAFEILENFEKLKDAPIYEFIRLKEGNPYRSVISTILAARTKDTTTIKIMPELFRKYPDATALSKGDEAEIEKLIYGVGFYKVKAKTIKQAAIQIVEKFAGKVPTTLEELTSLPGVGRKTANIVLNEIFDKDVISVDTHVFKISNRWGLIKTKTPEETEFKLMEIIPKNMWRKVNPILVAFGQTHCMSVSPFCSTCPLQDLCPQIGVGNKR